MIVMILYPQQIYANNVKKVWLNVVVTNKVRIKQVMRCFVNTIKRYSQCNNCYRRRILSKIQRYNPPLSNILGCHRAICLQINHMLYSAFLVHVDFYSDNFKFIKIILEFPKTDCFSTDHLTMNTCITEHLKTEYERK